MGEPGAIPAGQGTMVTARDWLAAHGRLALATVVSTWSSAPVPVGGQMLVDPEGNFTGSVSGGCIEGEVIVRAPEVMASGTPQILDIGVSDNVAWQAGLPCGGSISILVEALDGARDRDIIGRAAAAQINRESVAIRTDLGDGAHDVFDARAVLTDDIGAALKAGCSTFVASGRTGRAYVHVVTPAIRVIVVGATHVGQVLGALAARIGWRVVVVDPREAFASEARLGGLEHLVSWPAAAVAEIGLDAKTALVAVTHSGHIDDEALIAALASECFYVGALGSRKNHAARVERLRTAGLSDAQIARIRAPVGLAIGAQGPAEIAVSILAEIVQKHRGA